MEGSITYMVRYPHSSIPIIKRTTNLDTLQVWWIHFSVSPFFLRWNIQVNNGSGTLQLVVNGQAVLRR